MPETPPNKMAEDAQASSEETPPANPLQVLSNAAGIPAGLRIPDHHLLRCIGRGAYGEVWLARNVMGTYRAVKVVGRSNFETGRPFEREFAGIQNFEPVSRSHEGLVDILHVGRNVAAGYFFYVMELADDVQTGAQIDPARYQAKTLLREIQERGRLPVHECLRVCLGLARGLGCLHEQGLVHRDIKPSNIIFVKGAPKLADIGLVCGTEGALSHVGTEGYIAPEGAGTPRADLYSLGKVLYEMGTGKSRDHFPDLPTDLRENGERDGLLELNEVLLQACARDVRRRYQTAHDLEADLTLLEMGRSVRARHRSQKNWTRAVIAAGAAAAITLASLGFWVMQRGSWNQTSAAKISGEHLAKARVHVQEARFLAERSSSHLEGEQNHSRVIELLEQAVVLDPGFSEAHAELSLAYTLRMFLYAPEEKSLQQKAFLSVERAFALNPNLAMAYLARGRLQWTPSHHFAVGKALNDIARALELDPKLSEARQIRGQIFLHIGLLEEAQQDFAEAIELNPANNAAHFRIGEAYLMECEYQKALDVFERIDANFIPDFLASQICLALFGLGQIEAVRKHLDAHPTDSGGLLASVDAMVHASLQRKGEAENAIRRAITKRRYGHFHHTAYQVACAYALMNEKDLAFIWLKKASDVGLRCYPLFERDPNLASLRGDPRFTDFLAEEKKHFDSVKAKYGMLFQR